MIQKITFSFKNISFHCYSLLSHLTTLYLFLILTLFPLYLDLSSGYFTIDTDKAAIFLYCSIIYYVSFLLIIFFFFLRSIIKSDFNFHISFLLLHLKSGLSTTDYWVISYGLAVSLSFFFSDYQSEAFMGAEGWYMGFCFQLFFVGLYFICSRLLTAKQIHFLLYTSMVISILIFLLGIFNRYSINPLGISMVDPVFISTLGNIDWLGGYWSVIFPIILYLLISYKATNTKPAVLASFYWIFLYIATAIGFLLCLTLGADDAPMTLFFIVLFIGSSIVNQKKLVKNFIETLLLFCLIFLPFRISHEFFNPPNNFPTPILMWLCTSPFYWLAFFSVLVVYLLVNNKKTRNIIYQLFPFMVKLITRIVLILLTVFAFIFIISIFFPRFFDSFPFHSIYTFSDTWGSDRGLTGQIGISTWNKQNLIHKIFGIGPDSMSYYLYEKHSILLYHDLRQAFGNSTLTNAHCDYITILANLGIIGLSSYVGLLFHSAKRFLGKKERIFPAFGFSILGYMIYNIFSFQQMYNTSLLFIIIGFGSGLLRIYHKECKERNHTNDTLL